MRLSVVIPAFNEEKLLGRCLAAVAEAARELTRRGWEHEVIVCDNNSTDRTPEVAGAGGARVVFEPRNQIARARNTGARAARGDWLLFLDADCVPSPELFADLAQVLSTGRVLGGGARVALENPPAAGRALTALWNLISRLTAWAPGGFLFCEAAAFRTLDGFNEELFVSEEIDFSRRLKRLARAQGRRVVILQRHPVLTSARKLHLYTPGELRAFTWQYLRRPLAVARNRSACPIWYDGRR